MAVRQEQDSALSAIIIGTRGSKLALWQAGWVRERFEELRPDVKCELKIVKTSGDTRHDLSPEAFGSEGIFTAELVEHRSAWCVTQGIPGDVLVAGHHRVVGAGDRCGMHDLDRVTAQAGAVVIDIDHGGAVIGLDPVAAHGCLDDPVSFNFRGSIIFVVCFIRVEIIPIDG